MPKKGYGFTFNGVRSDDMGVLLVWYPELPRAKRNAQKLPIPGRSGALTVDDGSYADISFSLACRARGDADRAAVSAWLTGPGELVFDEEPGFAYRASLTEEFRYARYMQRSFAADFTVKADAQTFRYQTPPARLTLTAPGFVVNPGTVFAEPKLTLTGSGDIGLAAAGKTLLISALSGTLVVDCEAKLAYKPGADGAPATLATLSLAGDWPTLPPGPSAITWTGALESAVVEPNWRWL